MKPAHLLLAAAVLVVAGTGATELNAQNIVRGGGPSGIGTGLRGLRGFGGGFGYTTLFDLYRTRQIPLPPYFALHPPVYYQDRAFQTYGMSPFAYPYTWWQQNALGYANVAPPLAAGPGGAVRAPARVLIANPHAAAPATATTAPPTGVPAGALAGSQPRVIRNPFFDGELRSLAEPHASIAARSVR